MGQDDPETQVHTVGSNENALTMPDHRDIEDRAVQPGSSSAPETGHPESRTQNSVSAQVSTSVSGNTPVRWSWWGIGLAVSVALWGGFFWFIGWL
ncbi:MAG: hypothetical protein ACK5NN_08715 [Sphingomonadaceae bacterium]